MKLILNRHVLLIKIGNWTLYFPSSFGFGRHSIDKLYRNWSFCYLTLEQKFRQ